MAPCGTISNLFYELEKCQEAFNRRLPVCCFVSVMNLCCLLIPEYSGI